MMLALQFRRFTAGHSAAVERHGACWIGGAGLVVTCLHCVSFDGKRWAVDDEPGEYLLSADGEPAVRLDPVLAIPAFDVALLKIRGAPARAGAPLRVSADWLPERSPWHAETRPHSLHGDGIRLSGSLTRWSDRPCQPHQLTVLQGTDIDWASVSGSPVVHDESVVGMLRQQLDAGNTCFATSAHAIELTLWAARWHDTLVALRLPGLEADPLTRPARNLDRIAELLTTDGMTSAALERQLRPLPDAAARTALEAMFVNRPLPPAGSAEQDLCRRSLQAVRLAASSTSDSLLKIAFAAADAPANIFVAPRLRAVETATPASAAPPQPPQDSVDARPDPSISYEELIGRLTGAEAGELHRIAVLGEAGSGKSTLLGHLAREILERGWGLSIAFHFAQLGNAGLLQAIEAYWLPQIGIVGSRESYLLAVQRLARAGRLWIFIDGIDEVGLTHREPLEQISRSLVGALRDAHVLVASRHAYWYHGTNDLHGFRTYDLEVFTPERIFGFVEQWFVAEPDGGTALAAELKRPGRMYLLQAVRNPLRLAMLCALWRDRSKYRPERPLPSTRAELYEQFLALTYDWNLRRPKVGAVDRDALLAALSRLALQVLSNPSAEDPAHAGSFGDDAIEASNAGAPAEVRHALIEAGWVVRDGVLAPTRRRLRFAHRTWLEYFAARGLSKGIELLNLESHPPQTRFLESGWREVVLFWMGRPDVPVEEKRALLLRVVEFRDGMWGVYSTRAWQLVPACLQESTCFSEEESLMVVHELMSQAVGVKGPDGQSWLAGFPAFQAAAASALGDADPALVGRVAWAAVLEAQTLTRSPTRFWQSMASVLSQAAGTDDVCGDLAARLLLDPWSQRLRVETERLLSNPSFAEKLMEAVRKGGASADQALDILTRAATGNAEAADLAFRLLGGQTRLKVDVRRSLLRVLRRARRASPAQLAFLDERAFARRTTDRRMWLDTLGALTPDQAALAQKIWSTLPNPSVASSGRTIAFKVLAQFDDLPERIATEVLAIRSSWLESDLRHDGLDILRKAARADPDVLRRFTRDLERERNERWVADALNQLVVSPAETEVRLQVLGLLQSELSTTRFETARIVLGFADLSDAERDAGLQALDRLVEEFPQPGARIQETPWRAARWLRQRGIGRPALVERIVSMTRSSLDEDVRVAGLSLLGDIGSGSSAAASLLMDVLEASHPVPGVAFIALRSLEVLDAPSAQDRSRLLAIARTQRSGDALRGFLDVLRKWQVDDPAAAELAEQVVSNPPGESMAVDSALELLHSVPSFRGRGIGAALELTASDDAGRRDRGCRALKAFAGPDDRVTLALLRALERETEERQIDRIEGALEVQTAGKAQGAMAVPTLRRLLSDTDDGDVARERQRVANELLLRIASRTPYPTFETQWNAPEKLS